MIERELRGDAAIVQAAIHLVSEPYTFKRPVYRSAIPRTLKGFEEAIRWAIDEATAELRSVLKDEGYNL